MFLKFTSRPSLANASRSISATGSTEVAMGDPPLVTAMSAAQMLILDVYRQATHIISTRKSVYAVIV